MTGVHVGNDKVCRSTDLAVAGVLGEEDRLTGPSHLHEDGKPRLEAVFPVDLEAEPVDVEPEAAPRVGVSELRRDGSGPSRVSWG